MPQSARSRQHPPASDPPSVQLVRELANVRDCEPGDLEPLYGTVDLESLDDLVEGSDGQLTVEFTVDGDRVRIDDDGSVIVSNRRSR